MCRSKVQIDQTRDISRSLEKQIKPEAIQWKPKETPTLLDASQTGDVLSTRIEPLWNCADRIEVSNGSTKGTRKLIFKVDGKVIAEEDVPTVLIGGLKAKKYKRVFLADNVELVPCSYVHHYEEDSVTSKSDSSRPAYRESPFVWKTLKESGCCT